MIIANDLKQKYDEARSSKSVKTASPFSGEIAEDFMSKTSSISYDLGSSSYGIRGLTGAFLGTLPEATVVLGMNLIEDLRVKKYGDVKDDPRWIRMYRGKSRFFGFKDNNGKNQSQALFSFPCHYCGIFLPKEFIQVDHRQPQKEPGVAVLKVLHAMPVPPGQELTVGRAKGTKSRAAQQIVSAATGGKPSIDALPKIYPSNFTYGVKWATFKFITDRSKVDRYTITDAGKVFLSLCVMFWGAGGMEKRCLNSILNLVPACAHCNGSSGKSGRTHASP